MRLKASWAEFLRGLKERGLRGVRLVIGDRCLGLVEAAREVLPEAKIQRCVAHFYRKIGTAQGARIVARLKPPASQGGRHLTAVNRRYTRSSMR